MRAFALVLIVLAGCSKASTPAPQATTAPPPPATTAPPTPPATWPFHAWDRAEAVTFNHVPYGPGIPLRVYDEEHGWSPHLVDRKPIEIAQAERAIELVIATRGEIEVSKCPFPRHAIVFYAGTTPVGTANVCFECGDILVWPEFEPEAEGAKGQALYEKKLAAYDQVYPRWQALFRDELGLSIEPPPRR